MADGGLNSKAAPVGAGLGTMSMDERTMAYRDMSNRGMSDKEIGMELRKYGMTPPVVAPDEPVDPADEAPGHFETILRSVQDLGVNTFGGASDVLEDHVAHGQGGQIGALAAPVLSGLTDLIETDGYLDYKRRAAEDYDRQNIGGKLVTAIEQNAADVLVGGVASAAGPLGVLANSVANYTQMYRESRQFAIDKQFNGDEEAYKADPTAWREVEATAGVKAVLESATDALPVLRGPLGDMAKPLITRAVTKAFAKGASRQAIAEATTEVMQELTDITVGDPAVRDLITSGKLGEAAELVYQNYGEQLGLAAAAGGVLGAGMGGAADAAGQSHVNKRNKQNVTELATIAGEHGIAPEVLDEAIRDETKIADVAAAATEIPASEKQARLMQKTADDMLALPDVTDEEKTTATTKAAEARKAADATRDKYMTKFGGKTTSEVAEERKQIEQDHHAAVSKRAADAGIVPKADLSAEKIEAVISPYEEARIEREAAEERFSQAVTPKQQKKQQDRVRKARENEIETEVEARRVLEGTPPAETRRKLSYKHAVADQRSSMFTAEESDPQGTLDAANAVIDKRERAAARAKNMAAIDKNVARMEAKRQSLTDPGEIAKMNALIETEQAKKASTDPALEAAYQAKQDALNRLGMSPEEEAQLRADDAKAAAEAEEAAKAKATAEAEAKKAEVKAAAETKRAEVKAAAETKKADAKAAAEAKKVAAKAAAEAKTPKGKAKAAAEAKALTMAEAEAAAEVEAEPAGAETPTGDQSDTAPVADTTEGEPGAQDEGGNVGEAAEAIAASPTAEVTGAGLHLPDDPGQYFNTTHDSQMVPVSKLRPMKGKPSTKRSAGNAMRRAYDGKGEKRGPLTARAEKDGTFTVLEGNSTYANMAEAGWENAPVRVITDDQHQEEGAKRLRAQGLNASKVNGYGGFTAVRVKGPAKDRAKVVANGTRDGLRIVYRADDAPPEPVGPRVAAVDPRRRGFELDRNHAWVDKLDEVGADTSQADVEKWLADNAGDIEHSAAFGPDGKILGLGTNNDFNAVMMPKQSYARSGGAKEGVIQLHSHPVDTTFSNGDVEVLHDAKNVVASRVVLPGGRIIEMRPTPKLHAMSANGLREKLGVITHAATKNVPLNVPVLSQWRIRQDAILRALDAEGLIDYSIPIDNLTADEKEAVNDILDRYEREWGVAATGGSGLRTDGRTGTEAAGQDVADGGTGTGVPEDPAATAAGGADQDQTLTDAAPTAAQGVDDLIPTDTPIDNEYPRRISVRRPTSVNPEENSLTSDLQISQEVMERNPRFDVNVNALASYKALRDEGGTNHERALAFRRQIKENLIWLHNRIPKRRRDMTAQWYHGANKIARQMATTYGKSTHQMAGVIAALSPQNEWSNNLSAAERLVDTMSHQQDTEWSPQMDAITERVGSGGRPNVFKNAANNEDYQQVRGKRLRELTTDVQKAMWVRAYDEAHNPRRHRMAIPDGRFVGEPVASSSWGSFSEMGNAISIFENGSLENISLHTGNGHKVRSFYNNISEPDADRGDVTMDTHAVAAALYSPLSGNSTQVYNNFGSGPDRAHQARMLDWITTSGQSDTGASGTYGIIADAYRDAAAELGIKPRELQSITWEAVREHFTADWKSPVRQRAVDRVWDRYKAGNLTADEARRWVYAYARRTGGVQEVSPDSGTNVVEHPSAYKTDVSDDGRADGSGRGGGTGSRTAAAVPKPAIAFGRVTPAASWLRRELGVESITPEQAQALITRAAHVANVKLAQPTQMADGGWINENGVVETEPSSLTVLDETDPVAIKRFAAVLGEMGGQHSVMTTQVLGGTKGGNAEVLTVKTSADPTEVFKALNAINGAAFGGFTSTEDGLLLTIPDSDGYDTADVLRQAYEKIGELDGNAQVYPHRADWAFVGADTDATADEGFNYGTSLQLTGQPAAEAGVLLSAARQQSRDVFATAADAGQRGESTGPVTPTPGEPTPLYVNRPVIDDGGMLRHFTDLGLTGMVSPEDLHVTVTYSSAPVDVAKVQPKLRGREVSPLGKPIMLGPSLVQPITIGGMALDHNRYRSAGASHDFPRYLPHITIKKNATADDFRMAKVRAPRGEIQLGPEVQAVLRTEDGVTPSPSDEHLPPPAAGVDTPEFKEWFGDSKVVDPDGEPLVVYHGSLEKGLETFDTTRVTKRGVGDEAGTYFTGDQMSAGNYSRPAMRDVENKGKRGRVYPAYLRLQNPLDTTAAIKAGLKKGMTFSDAKRAALKPLDRSKHDGIIFQGNDLNPSEYVVFDPDQIRLAPKAPPAASGITDMFKSERNKAVEQVVIPNYLSVSVPKTSDLLNKVRDHAAHPSKALTTAAAKIEQQLFNRMSPIRRLEIATRGKLGIGAESPFKAAEMAVSDSGRAETLMYYGAAMLGKHGEFRTKPGTVGLRTIFDYAVEGAPHKGQAITDWMAFMVARRAKDLRARGIPVPVTDAEINAALAKSSPAFIKAADAWRAHNEANIDFLVDTGRITKAQADGMKLEQHYVPFYRDETKHVDGTSPELNLAHFLSDAGGGKGGGHLLARDPGIKKMIGGEKQAIDNLMHTMVKNSQAMVAAGMRNKAANLTFDLLVEAGDARIVKKGKQQGGFSSKPKDAIVMWQDGKEKYVQVSEDAVPIAVAMAAMTPVQLTGVSKFAAQVASTFRQGVTISAVFIARNAIRGAVSTGLMTSGANLPLPGSVGFNTLTGFLDAMRKGDATRAFTGLSGMGDYRFGGTDTGAGKNDILIDYGLNKTNPGYRIRQALNMFEKVGTATELADRIAAFETMKKNGIREDEAAYQALTVMNYSRHGANGVIRTMMPMMPFVNARLQGLSRITEGALGRDGAELSRGKAIVQLGINGIILTAVGAALWGWNNLFDEERREKYKAEPLYRRVNNHILYLGDKTLLIPKAFELGMMFNSIPEMMLDAAANDMGDEFKPGVMQVLLQTFGFNLIPAALTPYIEATANHSFFRDQPIEGPRAEKLLPRDRTEGASAASILIGQKLGVTDATGLSPTMLEHYAQGYGGVYYHMLSSVVGAVGNELGLTPPPVQGAFGTVPVISPAATKAFSGMLKATPLETNKYLGAFYDDVDHITQIYTSAKAAATNGDVEYAKQLLAQVPGLPAARRIINKANYKMGQLNSAIRVTRADTRLSSSEKAKRLAPMIKARNELARQVTEVVDQIEDQQGQTFAKVG